MSLEVELKLREGYLEARALGRRSVLNISALARKVAQACVEHNLDSALIDARKLAGNVSVYDVLMIPTRVFPSVRQLGILRRLALLDTEERQERIAFFERVSRKAGYNLRAFTDRKAAVNWLTNDSSSE